MGGLSAPTPLAQLVTCAGAGRGRCCPPAKSPQGGSRPEAQARGSRPPAGSFILFFACRVRVAPLVGTRRSPWPPPHLPASSAAFSGAGPRPPLPGRPAPRISFYSLGITRPRENSIPPLIRLILESSLRRKVTGTDKGLVGKPRHLTLVPRRPFSGADATLPSCPGCSPRPRRVLAAPADPGTTGDVLRLGGGVRAPLDSLATPRSLSLRLCTEPDSSPPRQRLKL